MSFIFKKQVLFIFLDYTHTFSKQISSQSNVPFKKNRLVHWLSCNTMIDISCFLNNGLTRLLLPVEVLCPAKPCWKKDFAKRLINIEIWSKRERSSQTAEKILFSASAILCQYIVFYCQQTDAHRLITTISQPLKVGTNAGLKKMTRCDLVSSKPWLFMTFHSWTKFRLKRSTF